MKRIILIVVIIAVLVLAIIFLVLPKLSNKSNSNQPNFTSETVSFSQDILANKFGFLSGEKSSEYKVIAETGSGWVRPHPGKFIWNEMESSQSAKMDFSQTDELVLATQENNLGLLVTVWPYADWDQKNRSDSVNCKVSNSDQFKNTLPDYRCAPNNWLLYDRWLGRTVERYDGDGVEDMPGLKYPVRYWEISNEPDLSFSNAGDSSLTFFEGTEADYAELLKKSYQIIRSADNNAQVLIAGAANENEQFFNFWRNVFKVEGVKDSFDIANIHNIGPDNNGDLNVAKYKNLLAEFSITKSIWVTEAENDASGDKVKALENSVAGAIKSGAEKIFFTGASLTSSSKNYGSNLEKEKEYYKSIIEKY